MSSCILYSAFIFVFSYASSAGTSTIKQLAYYREVQAIFDTCDQNTLITFDVDDTLISTVDVMARNFDHPLWFKIRAAFRYPQLLFSQYAFEWCASIVFMQDRRIVFDPDIVSIIQKLREQNIPVLALTSMDSGSFGCIDHMPTWRANMLKNFGFDFDGQYPDTIFDSLRSYHSNYPVLYRGILCANQLPKGEVLGAFLDHYQIKPTHIISFDDQLEALLSIAHACANRNIEFAGYQITGAQRLPGAWNTQRALIQLDSVMQCGRWLSDVEADMVR